MYVHHKCRCEECCKAEHEQYLKRISAKSRARYNSKWTDEIVPTIGRESQRRYNASRYRIIKETSTHAHKITWREVAERDGKLCAICGCICDERDCYIGEDGKKRYGRMYPTVDHIRPLKQGGTDTMDNVQVLCKHCNSSKGAKWNETTSRTIVV